MRVFGASVRPLRATVLVVALAATRSAWAIEPEVQEKARVTYDAPDSCPGRDAFLAQIRERIGTDWEAAGEELARTIDVRVVASATGFTATIAFLDAGGGRVERSIAGTKCEEVVQGLALVTSLAIRAQVLPEQPEEPGEAKPIERPKASAPVPPQAAAKASNVPRRKRTARVARSQPVTVRAGGRAVVETAAGPGLSEGPGGFIALEHPLGVVELAVDAVGTGSVVENGVSAEFNLVAARASACVALRFDNGISLEAGPYVRSGIMTAEAAVDPPTVARSSTGHAMWIAPGLLGRVTGRLGPIFGEFELDGRFPLEREQFYVAEQNGDRTVYRVAGAGVGAALGLGLHF